MTEELALASAAASLELSAVPPCPAKNPPPGAPPAKRLVGVVVVVVAVDVVGATVRVTMMSVPTDPSGESALV